MQGLCGVLPPGGTVNGPCCAVLVPIKLGQLRETDFVAVIVDVAVDATATVTLTVAATGHRDGRGRGHENGRVHVNDHGLRFSNWFRVKSLDFGLIQP